MPMRAMARGGGCRQQIDLQALVAETLDGAGGARAGGVGEGQHARDLAVERDRERGPPVGLECVEVLLRGRKVHRVLGHQARRADDRAAALDGRQHAATDGDLEV